MKRSTPGTTILLTSVSLLVLMFIQAYIILQQYRMKEEIFDIQYNSVVLKTLNKESGFTMSPLDSAYYEFDAIALHNIPAFDESISESARISAGNQLKEVFTSLLMEYQDTRNNIKTALKSEGLDTSFTIQYAIRYIEFLDFNKRIPVYQSIDTLNQIEFSTGLYLRTYQTEQDYFAAEFDLFLDFTGKARIIMKEMAGIVAVVSLTLIVVLAAFVSTLRSLWRQKKLNNLKSDFIDNISHEFKTPLTSISLAATSIKHPAFLADADKVTELADSILLQNKTLNQMIDQVIDVSLVETKQIYLNPEEIFVFDYLEETKTRLLKEYPGKKIHLQTHWDIPDDLKIKLDKNQIYRVMRNIFNNAVKYSGGIPDIEIHAKQNGQFLRLSVTDRGIGIDAETLKHIFDRFYRAESSRSKAKGLGLGLYIVKRIMETHKGKIDIQSIPGKKTCVKLFLPLDESTESH